MAEAMTKKQKNVLMVVGWTGVFFVAVAWAGSAW